MSTRLAVVHSDDLGMAYADHPAIECWPPDAQDRRPVLYGIGAIVGIGAVILAFSPLGRGD